MSNPKIQGSLIGAMLAEFMLAAAITVNPIFNSPSIWSAWLTAIAGAVVGALIGYAYVVVWTRWRAKW
ncbi:hypothetical protein [Mesorhizobium sp.]|uniref:hypothetical protein n=1 Tax=Mesorhizobium sp. TaxID=1871066 RepID=UPI001223146D|nr:hypothetical protein [Mesorhizobium sp.]TIX28878.1 MAG: hypothetical protein E5V35_00520 [Mesorhizobium sp.]